ncbi:MAG: hypothetical protein HOD43_13980 [Candidatus Marinimicrobia bacterium]|jgi:predicted anti-sigma-YlaC factor YlaD|nr:hypothetical protein [Candidatus Neomarinimicrobiota bacterium]MBT3631822.1 hypothetical protein [Candidatus Neomarinimicrobiota bacterium]MBT3825232.1 hypothetical protein [Candidatus Neomarinimicrobiota bacterium]MBT4130918.1 hypothetical protein [Candidatus Neomarinimicrobiota bacterium]MBT4296903.1 hypothetical protein [Candidatus Neomarinimicrobiota bacterium]
MGKPRELLVVALMAGGLCSCSVQKMAINSVADALSGSTSGVFATDDLPEFVAEAVPFGLKLNEAILEQTPEHKGLLLALASGYAQYSYAFVQLPADTLTPWNLKRSKELKSYAKKLYLRSRYYAFRAIEVDSPNFKANLFDQPDLTLEQMTVEDVPTLYWLGLSWMGAISITMADLELLAQLQYADKILQRCLELDESYGEGALHEFFITYDGSRNEAMGGGAEKARAHYQRALELSGGKKASPHVALATTVAIQNQDVEAYRSLLSTALAIDTNAYPQYKLENTIAQRKANWYLKNVGDYFLIDDGEDDND